MLIKSTKYLLRKPKYEIANLLNNFRFELEIESFSSFSLTTFFSRF